MIRTIGESVALALSSEHGGDVEVVMQARDCERLLLALRQAIVAATVPR